jgi:threonyl-tRNA synthetase
MAAAVESLFPGTKFGIGPPIETGFYYDLDMGDHTLTGEDLKKIEERMVELSTKNDPYVREVRTWEDAATYFKEKKDPYKLELLEDLKGQQITFYHSGEFTDLCYGPHLATTAPIKAIKLLSVAGAYWRGNEKNKQLTRIYGITFPKQKQLDDYLEMLEQAKLRDHRKLGKELELFTFSQKVGQGLPLWLPRGAALREKLEAFLNVVDS